MGEITDKLKGSANKAAGRAKQSSSNPAVREEGRRQESRGRGQKIKGATKGVINEL